MNPTRHQAGWSLTETMVTVAIVAVLMSWAWPQWNAIRQTQHRQHAQMHLHQLAQDLSWAILITGKRPPTLSLQQSQLAGLPYRFELASSGTAATSTTLTDATAYVLWARPLADQSADPCGELWLDHTGRKGVNNASRASLACWSRAP